MKKCSQCKKILDLLNFTKRKDRKSGYRSNCKNCQSLSMKNKRKTKIGKINLTYNDMKKRVNCTKRYDSRYYNGLELLPREDFVRWSLSCKNFNKYFSIWKKSNYKYKLSPSIDRIDTKEGYTLDNIQWLNVVKNSLRIQPKIKISNRQIKLIRNLYKLGNYTQRELANKFGCSQSNISCIVRFATRKKC